MLRVAGALRACWPIGLVFIGPGLPGLLLVMVVELGLITCIGVFNPVLATYRLEQVPADRIARTLAAWQVTGKAHDRRADGTVGRAGRSRRATHRDSASPDVLLLATPVLLPRRAHSGRFAPFRCGGVRPGVSTVARSGSSSDNGRPAVRGRSDEHDVQSARQGGPHGDQRLVQGLGRFGDACYGIVYIVVAWLALQIAFGDKSTQANQKGAVTEIAAQPFGLVLLWILAVGLIAFGLWQLLAAANGYRWVQPKRKRTVRRLSSVGRAIVVFAIASFTLRLLVSGNNGKSGDCTQQEMTAKLLAVPGGKFLVILIGLGVVVAGVLAGRRAVGHRFLRDLDLRSAAAGVRSG